jgi:hypothetical protein
MAMRNDREIGILAFSHFLRDLNIQLVCGLQIRHNELISAKVALIKRSGK